MLTRFVLEDGKVVEQKTLEPQAWEPNGLAEARGVLRRLQTGTEEIAITNPTTGTEFIVGLGVESVLPHLHQGPPDRRLPEDIAEAYKLRLQKMFKDKERARRRFRFYLVPLSPRRNDPRFLPTPLLYLILPNDADSACQSDAHSFIASGTRAWAIRSGQWSANGIREELERQTVSTWDQVAARLPALLCETGTDASLTAFAERFAVAMLNELDD